MPLADPVARRGPARLVLKPAEIAFWLFVMLASLSMIVNDLRSLDGLQVRNTAMIGRDFLNAWAGGQLVVQGRIDAIYSIGGYVDALGALTGERLDVHVFSYPPTLLLFLWPFGFVAYLPALIAWLVATGGAYLAAARSYLARAELPFWIAALSPAAVVNIWAGHYGFVVAALWLLAFAALPRRPLLAGCLFALLTLKPHMGLLIPPLLAIRGEWRAFGGAAAGTLLLAGLSLAVFGAQAWQNYLDVTLGYQAALLEQERGFFLAMMPTPYISFARATGSASLAALAHAGFALAALVPLWRAARRGIAWPDLGLMAATATFLVLPYGFNYDMLVVSLAAAIVVHRHAERLGRLDRLATMLTIAAPILVFLFDRLGLPLLPAALLWFLFVQDRLYGVAGGDVRISRVAPAAATSAH